MDICDPEWGPFFMNYKWLKKQLHIVANELESLRDAKGETVSRSDVEKEFFRGIMTEMRRVSDFFESTEKSCLIRRARIITGIEVLRGLGTRLNKHDWSRTLAACVKFYKDAVLIENFAILHLSGFGKIIKKHDKITGFKTRESFTKNVIYRQNFVNHSFFSQILAESEALFHELRGMETVFVAIEDGNFFWKAMSQRSIVPPAVMTRKSKKTPPKEVGTASESVPKRARVDDDLAKSEPI